MGKTLGFLGLLTLAGCGSTGKLHVDVSNNGTVAIVVEGATQAGSSWGVYTSIERFSGTVAPGQVGSFTTNFSKLDQLQVTIFRTTDQFKILEDTWTRDEVENLGRYVSITVTP